MSFDWAAAKAEHDRTVDPIDDFASKVSATAIKAGLNTTDRVREIRKAVAEEYGEEVAQARYGDRR